MKVVQLLPTRAANERNTVQERKALIDAGYNVRSISSPYAGLRGIIWLETVGACRASRLKPDVIVARDLDSFKAGLKVKEQTGAKLVYDVHEAFSWMIEDDVPRFLVNAAIKREQRLLTKADAIIASNPGIIDWLVQQAPKDGIGIDDPITLVANCRDPQPEFIPPLGQRQLCYLGTLHKTRFIKEMVEAMRGIDGRLVISGPRTAHSLYDWLKVGNLPPDVQFLGHITPEKVESIVRESDVVVSMVDPSNKNNRVGLANKVFEAMSIGRPVIATTGTATGNLVTNLRMGITTMYDQDAFAEGVKVLLDGDDLVRLGKNAYDACKNGVWNWQTQAKKFVAVFDGLTA